mmetsp:Transcript_47569/g.113192  ORF Transcript_47569/g.113192 Transcript_47569/m.113192 type:complete len:107 (-) Transcript_47569:2-322(-)
MVFQEDCSWYCRSKPLAFQNVGGKGFTVFGCRSAQTASVAQARSRGAAKDRKEVSVIGTLRMRRTLLVMKAPKTAAQKKKLSGSHEPGPLFCITHSSPLEDLSQDI